MMKKLLLLTLVAGSVLSASAQHSAKFLKASPQTRIKALRNVTQKVNLGFGQMAKTTSVPFETETFGTGNSTTLPIGWSSSAAVGVGNWRWINDTSSYQYNIGKLNSSTASDGWMILDSDSIGASNTALTAFSVYLQSPSYNCAGHSTVQLGFQQYFRQFNDSCFVQVSIDGGSTFTTFPVTENNALNATDALPNNPTNTRINISSVAANQSNVIIRFLYSYDGPVLGGYNWLVDDMTLSELDPLEFSIGEGAVAMYDGFGDVTSFYAIPSQLLNPLVPVVNVSNEGATAPTFAEVSARIYKGNTLDYTSIDTLNDLGVGAQDSLLVFDNYTTTATGTYHAAFSSDLAGDAFADNNVDSVNFQVTDSIYHRVGEGPINLAYYVHRAAATNPTTTELNLKVGSWMVIPAGLSDTITGVSVAFSNSSQAGANVVVAISKLDTTTGTFTEYTRTQSKVLTAANISPANGVTWSYFAIDNVDDVIIDEGTYAVTVIGNNSPADKNVLVLVGATTSGALNRIHGILAESINDGAALSVDDTASISGIFDSSPLIRMHFGRHVSVGVKDVKSIAKLDAYPNPATSNVTISFELKNDANANLTVTNAVGQTVKNIAIGQVFANQSKEVSISTSGLSNGVYFYTISANGEKLTKRIVINK